MKLDGEQVLCHGTIDHKPHSKHFVCTNIAVDSTGLKSGNGIVNEDQNGAFYDLKGRGGNTDQLQYTDNEEDNWTAPKLDCSMRVDASIDDNEKEVRDFVAPLPLTHSSLKVESFDRDSVFYVDKSVMEPELPELVVCYKENTYHVVKDICIDEGVPSQVKFLFDTSAEEENLCSLVSSEKHINSEVANKRVDQDACIPDVLKSSAEDEKLAIHLPIPDVFLSSEEKSSKNEFPIVSDSKELMPTGKLEDDAMKKITNDSSKEIFSLGELLSMPEVGTEHSQPMSSHNSMDEVEQQSIQRPSEDTVLATASSCDESQNGSEQSFLANPVVSVAERSDCSHEEAISGAIAPGSAAKALDHGHNETVLASPVLNSTTKESESGGKEETMAIHSLSCLGESTNTIEHELSYSGNVKTQSITHDCNSSMPKASTGEEGSQNGGSEHVESLSSRAEETNTDLFSSQLQYSLGESSFSAAGPLSGLITYSGPIAYSGSLSLRSDSSTTSTRSFAFPILQPEWNSSPVRMAKADRRHFRKHRSWREGLLCCRF